MIAEFNFLKGGGHRPPLHWLGLGPPRQQPQNIRHAVEENDALAVAQLAAFQQGADTPFGAAAGGARQVERRGAQVRAGRGPALEGGLCTSISKTMRSNCSVISGETRAKPSLA